MSSAEGGMRNDPFSLVNVVEIISITVFITGGAFIASAWLIGVIASEPAADSVQLAMTGTGVGLSSVGIFIRWLLSRWG